ncbi:MAG: hypothetical protein CL947_02625 [Epsilonproteobacteria bacterium]|nr:hypothetical protein [Campylobacterota bacterium]|tara:strand:- start:16 stop:2493 length:2478 start_codon:yes stop_codon:yes gene_type:complete
MNKNFLHGICMMFCLATLSVSLFAQEDKQVATETTDNAPADSLTSHDERLLEMQREQLEQMITEVREQTQTISFCVQQIIQAVQANKIAGTKAEKIALQKELVELQNFTQLLLNKVFVHVDPENLPIGFILNNTISRYLVKTLKTNPLSINVEYLNTLIERNSKQKLTNLQPETLYIIISQNKKSIAELLETTDFLGLSWTNKTYRYLKQKNAYSYMRGAGVTVFTAFVAACLYKAYFKTESNKEAGYFDKALNWVGKPGFIPRDKDGRPTKFNENGEVVGEPGSGIFTIWEMFKTGSKYGLVAATPLITIPLPEIAKKLYYQYWLNLQKEVNKRWKRFDEICTGTDKKYDFDDCEKVYFKDMTGAVHLEDLAKKLTNYMKHPERYERAQIEEHRAVLLQGPPQTGKTLFAKALRTMITENLDKGKKISFIDAKKILDIDQKATIDEIFDYAKHIAPCILFIDELDLVGAHREKNPITTGQLLTCMQGVDMASKQVIVIGATNKLEQLDKALLVDGRFGKIIHIGYPNYYHRKLYLEQQLLKRSIHLAPEFIDYIAQETEGASYNKLKRIIMESLILSSLKLQPVCQEDFEKTLDSEVRKIENVHAAMPTEEKRIIATHQAGKALMRHLLQTKREVVKITIHPVAKEIQTNEFGWAIKTDSEKKSENDKAAEPQKDLEMKNGEVFTKIATTNHTLISDEEYKKECLSLLAGNIAQKVLLNNTFTKCNPQDRGNAMKIIYSLISNGESIDKVMKAQALDIKTDYEKDIEKILLQHKDILQTITDKLIENNTINRHEWHEIIQNYPVLDDKQTTQVIQLADHQGATA